MTKIKDSLTNTQELLQANTTTETTITTGQGNNLNTQPATQTQNQPKKNLLGPIPINPKNQSKKERRKQKNQQNQQQSKAEQTKTEQNVSQQQPASKKITHCDKDCKPCTTAGDICCFYCETKCAANCKVTPEPQVSVTFANGTTNKSYAGNYKYEPYVKGKKTCHVATEVYPGLVLGSYANYKDMIAGDLKCDILVPLNDLDHDVWKDGWCGDIFYVPIKDFGYLPREIAKFKAAQVAEFIKNGKKIGMFCIGGHGRTGYFGSIVLHYLGIEDPIEMVRKYCKNTVETTGQIKEVCEIIGRSDLIEKYDIPESKKYSKHSGAKTYGAGFVSYANNRDECRDCLDFVYNQDANNSAKGTCQNQKSKSFGYSKYDFAIPCDCFRPWQQQVKQSNSLFEGMTDEEIAAIYGGSW